MERRRQTESDSVTKLNSGKLDLGKRNQTFTKMMKIILQIN
jgi:hypothetical protein